MQIGLRSCGVASHRGVALQIAALMKQNAALEAKVSNLSTAEGPGFGLQALGAIPKFTCKVCK